MERVIRLREQAARLRLLASLGPDKGINEQILQLAVETEVSAAALEKLVSKTGL